MSAFTTGWNSRSPRELSAGTDPDPGLDYTLGVPERRSEPSPVVAADRGYPTHTAVDAVFPAQTTEPLEPVFAGVATPAIWSRLGDSLGLVLEELWRAAGLANRVRPRQWVSLHLGRIAVNAHGWEALRARLQGIAPDPALVEPGSLGSLRWPGLLRRAIAADRRRVLRKRVSRAERLAEASLDGAFTGSLRDLEIAELARGPLDASRWREVLIPWFALRLLGEDAETSMLRVEHAIAIERRYYTEFGHRLVSRGQLRDPAEVAYLTVDERLRAVHGEVHESDTATVGSNKTWMELTDRRAARISDFLRVELPGTFWGRPRVELEEKR